MFSNNLVPDDTAFNNLLIKPPENNEHIKIKTKLLVIDSRDRDLKKYPDASNYKIYLNQEFKYLKYIQLIQYQIPNSMYLIENDNNSIHFSEKTDFTDDYLIHKSNTYNCNKGENIIEIPNGNYDIFNNSKKDKKPFLKENYLFTDELSIEIEKKFNSKFNDDSIQVLYNKRKDNYWFITNFKTNNGELSPLTLFFKGKKVGYGDKDIEKMIKRNKYNEIVRDENNNPVYEEITNEKYKFLFKEKSMGKLLGFKNKNYNGYLGTFDFDTSKKYIKINNKKNLDLIESQDILLINYQDTKQRDCVKIIKITDSYITIDKTIGYNKFYLFSSIIKSENRRSIENEFKILKIKNCKRLKSTNTNIQDSFCIVGLTSENMSLEGSNDDIYYKKYFNPLLPRLSEMEIQFFNYNNNPYKFNGQEHLLVFILGLTNQSIHYQI